VTLLLTGSAVLEHAQGFPVKVSLFSAECKQSYRFFPYKRPSSAMRLNDFEK